MFVRYTEAHHESMEVTASPEIGASKEDVSDEVSSSVTSKTWRRHSLQNTCIKKNRPGQNVQFQQHVCHGLV